LYPRAVPFEFERAKVKCYLTVMGAEQIADLLSRRRVIVEHLEIVKARSGKVIKKYQRSREERRIGKIVNFLEQPNAHSIIPAILPQNVVLNVREGIRLTHSGQVVTLPDNLRFHVVDGQHRIEALSRVVQDLPIPVTITSGLSEVQEAGLFLLINHTQKRVPAAIRLLDIAGMMNRHAGVDLDPLMKAMGMNNADRNTLVIAADQVLKRGHFWYDKMNIPGSEER
jgi:DGQHR domain-containing protein